VDLTNIFWSVITQSERLMIDLRGLSHEIEMLAV
jgi:hypothetical protein